MEENKNTDKKSLRFLKGKKTDRASLLYPPSIQIIRYDDTDEKILFENDFMAFFEDRKEQILHRIELATGKKIVRENNYLDDTVYEEEPVGNQENQESL